MDTVDITLHFGHDGVLQTHVPRSLVAAYHRGPEPVGDLEARLATALSAPLDFPALRQAVLAEDQIVLILDRDTPRAAELIRGIWDVLSSQGLQPDRVLILQPAALTRHTQPDPRQLLPEDVRERVGWIRHDATGEDGQFAYLAATTAGERVYLAREAVEADLVLTIGPICFDSVLGHRGTSSVLYPGLSRSDAIGRAHGQGHDELGPADQRGIRQTIDEVGWLLGVQFAVQVIPGGGGDVAKVIAGAQDAVFDEGKRQLDDHWRVTLDQRVEFVVVAVEKDEAGHDWAQVGAALDTARRLVEKDGRILVLSQLRGELTPGLELLQNCRTPRDALQPLRKSAPEDLVAATQFARAADWAKVYLLSDLEDDIVEDLFAFPLGSVDEARRLIESADRMAIIASAQHVYADVRPD
jgi:nickel-dependent lactate racemase